MIWMHSVSSILWKRTDTDSLFVALLLSCPLFCWVGLRREWHLPNKPLGPMTLSWITKRNIFFWKLDIVKKLKSTFAKLSSPLKSNYPSGQRLQSHIDSAEENMNFNNKRVSAAEPIWQDFLTAAIGLVFLCHLATAGIFWLATFS